MDTDRYAADAKSGVGFRARREAGQLQLAKPNAPQSGAGVRLNLLISVDRGNVADARYGLLQIVAAMRSDAPKQCPSLGNAIAFVAKTKVF